MPTSTPRLTRCCFAVSATACCGGPTSVEWLRACAAVGVEGLRFHDLRPTGNTLAATTGASLKDLMGRMGHASTRAALVISTTVDRDKAIAAALSELATGADVLPLRRRRGSEK